MIPNAGLVDIFGLEAQSILYDWMLCIDIRALSDHRLAADWVAAQPHLGRMRFSVLLRNDGMIYDKPQPSSRQLGLSIPAGAWII